MLGYGGSFSSSLKVPGRVILGFSMNSMTLLVQFHRTTQEWGEIESTSGDGV